jgi:phage baseplate assembly protein W
MPVEVTQRTSRGFKDISMSFQENPLTNDLIPLKNENAIAQSIKNLILTSPGERFFNPNLGSGIFESLFDNIDFISATQLQASAENIINTYEPRVRLIEVKVDPRPDDNAFVMTVSYEIVGINAAAQSLSFPLTKIR